MGLYQELQQKLKELEYSVKQLRHTGAAFAQAEKDYKITLRKKALQLRAEGQPVGMIDKLVYGDPEVAEARFKRDCAESIYQANTEHLNATKLYIRIIEGQIEREWTQAGRQI